MLYFLLGLILGILIRDIKVKTLHQIERMKEERETKGGAQFFESMNFRERFDKAKNLEDLLD